MSTSPVKIWRHQKIISSLLKRKGKIISWTIIRTPPAGYEQEAPYPVVLVKLDNGLKFIGQLVDWEEKDLKFGKKVETVYRRIIKPDPEGIIPYGIKFRPL